MCLSFTTTLPVLQSQVAVIVSSLIHPLIGPRFYHFSLNPPLCIPFRNYHFLPDSISSFNYAFRFEQL